MYGLPADPAAPTTSGATSVSTLSGHSAGPPTVAVSPGLTGVTIDPSSNDLTGTVRVTPTSLLAVSAGATIVLTFVLGYNNAPNPFIGYPTGSPAVTYAATPTTLTLTLPALNIPLGTSYVYKYTIIGVTGG